MNSINKVYQVHFIPAFHLDKIKDEWINLEKGKEMTIFQSFEWNLMLLQNYIPIDTKNFESVYGVVEKNNKCCMIAPLWIIKHTFKFLNKKGIYLLGRDSYSDYLNFIYDQFDANAFKHLITEIKNVYSINLFYFEHLREQTSLYKHILNSANSIPQNIIEPCVSLSLPKTTGDYYSILSKHTRQNLRTANNRLVKDGKSIVKNLDDFTVNRENCLQIRESKLSAKYAQVSPLKKYKYRLINRLTYHFPRFTPTLAYKKGRIMTAYINGELCAYFNYVYDDTRKCVLILSAGTDLSLARYSPGMLLMHNFVSSTIENGIYESIDFTRGDEDYKLYLGGEINRNHIIKFII